MASSRGRSPRPDTRSDGISMWAERNGTCRVKKAEARLSMTYTFPVLTGDVSPQLRKRWTRFMKGVVKHEETHGTIARQMVRAAELSIAGLATCQRPGLSEGKGGSEETGRESLCPVREAPDPFRLEGTWRRRKCGTPCDGSQGQELIFGAGKPDRSQAGRVPIRKMRAQLVGRCVCVGAVVTACRSSSAGGAPANSENSTRTGKWSEPASSCTVTERTTTFPFART